MSKVMNLKDDKACESSIPNIVRIDRATLWGNPFIIGVHGDRDTVCDAYLEWLNKWIEYKEEIRIPFGIRVFSNKEVVQSLEMLKGKDLACWCAPERCHGDTLLKLANR
jgi:hypothetical protein